MKAATVVVTLFLSAVQLSAQGMMQRPGPGHERAKLAFLTGTFATETHMPPSPMNPQEVVGKGTSTLRYGVDSMFILLDDQLENPVLGKYKAHGVLGYDVQHHRYTLAMFNNFGDAPHYTGVFNGDTLVLKATLEYPGGSFDQKMDWYKEGSNVRLKVYNDVGRGLTLVIDQIATPVSTGTEK